mmetsp:Transcript_8626/g.36499  ORF Transcript_8626/g.36499 Transcript_8626/m.36499 type:complete len:207 (-) Transcript_8626:1371-1991(-)
MENATSAKPKNTPKTPAKDTPGSSYQILDQGNRGQSEGRVPSLLLHTARRMPCCRLHECTHTGFCSTSTQGSHLCFGVNASKASLAFESNEKPRSVARQDACSRHVARSACSYCIPPADTDACTAVSQHVADMSSSERSLFASPNANAEADSISSSFVERHVRNTLSGAVVSSKRLKPPFANSALSSPSSPSSPPSENRLGREGTS